MDIKAKILEYIRAHQNCSFVELERFFESIGYAWRGEKAFVNAEYEHVVFWTGWSEEAVQAIVELEDEGFIRKWPARPFVYLMDGAGLTLPKVECFDDLKADHWLPVVLTASMEAHI